MTPEQQRLTRECRKAAEALNAVVVQCRGAGLDVMLAVNEPKPPLGVQSVHPVIGELEGDVGTAEQQAAKVVGPALDMVAALKASLRQQESA